MSDKARVWILETAMLGNHMRVVAAGRWADKGEKIKVIALDDIRPLIDALKFNMKEWEAVAKEAKNLVAWQKSRDALILLPDEIVGGDK